MIDPKESLRELDDRESKEMEESIREANQGKIEEAAQEAQEGLDLFPPDDIDSDDY